MQEKSVGVCQAMTNESKTSQIRQPTLFPPRLSLLGWDGGAVESLQYRKIIATEQSHVKAGYHRSGGVGPC